MTAPHLTDTHQGGVNGGGPVCLRQPTWRFALMVFEVGGYTLVEHGLLAAPLQNGELPVIG